MRRVYFTFFFLMEKKNLDIISESLFVGFNYLCAFKRDAFVISNIQLKLKKKKKGEAEKVNFKFLESITCYIVSARVPE